jgi:hypothetical protein
MIVSATVPDSALGETFKAIADFKAAVASGNAGWLPVRAAEVEFGGDRFAGQTTTIKARVPANHTRQKNIPFEMEEGIKISVFLPSRLGSEENNVFLFFGPGEGTEESPETPGLNATNVHAIRAGADGTNWIVIGIPGQVADDVEIGWNAFDNAAIAECLKYAGRVTTISKLRLCAHSRGIRGLTKTVVNRHIDLRLLDKVIVLDVPHLDLANNLPLVMPPGTRAPPIISYSQRPGVGARTALNADGVRAIGFARLIQDRTDVPPPPRVASLIAKIADLPALGSFSTGAVSGPTARGKTDIHRWIKDHGPAIDQIARVDRAAEMEWDRFFKARGRPLNRSRVESSPYFHVNTENLMRFFSRPLIDPGTGRPLDAGFPMDIYAHHLFVAEISWELFG